VLNQVVINHPYLLPPSTTIHGILPMSRRKRKSIIPKNKNVTNLPISRFKQRLGVDVGNTWRKQLNDQSLATTRAVANITVVATVHINWQTNKNYQLTPMAPAQWRPSHAINNCAMYTATCQVSANVDDGCMGSNSTGLSCCTTCCTLCCTTNPQQIKTI